MFGTPTLDTASIGVKTFYLQSNGTVKNLQFQNNLGFIGSITNISIKEVGQDWTIEDVWTIGDGVANGNGANGNNEELTQSLNFDSSKKYKISYQISNYVSGSVRYSLTGGGGYNGQNKSANGTYVDIINTWASHNQIKFFGLNFNGSVTNISVKEITDDTNIPRINYEGFSYQDSLGSELVTNGDFATNSDWTLTGATISGGKVNVNSSSPIFIVQNNVAAVWKQYKVELTVSYYVEGDLRLRYPFTISESEFTGNVTYVFYGAAADAIFELQGRFSGQTYNYSIDNVSVKEYLGQEVVPDSGCGSWLLEGQGTNLITYSEDFNNSYWSKSSNVTITQNYGVSPDGTQNSTRIQGDAGSIIYRSGFIATDSRSIYVRATSGSGTIQALSHNTNTNNIFNINENWKRVEVNSTPLVSGNFYVVDFRGASTDIFDIEVWGAQSENQSYATSYIPTNGATNTRLKDIATNSGNSSLINSTEGVLYTEMSSLANDGTNKYITINDGGTTDYLFFRYRSDNNFQVKLRSANTDKVNQTLTLPDNLDLNKIAFSYKENEFKIFVNGLQIGNTITTVATSAANTLNRVDFSRYDGASNFIGKNKALAVYKEALTDASLRCLTYPNPVATTFDLDFDTIAEQFTFTRGSEACLLYTSPSPRD